MCGGNRTGSLGNSAAVQPVGLVNFIMQVSAFSPSICFMLFFLLESLCRDQSCSWELRERCRHRGFFPSRTFFFPHRGILFVCARGFFPLGMLKLKTEKPFLSGLLSSDVFDIVDIVSFVLVGRWICFSVIRCFDIVSLCWWIVEPVSVFLFYSLVLSAALHIAAITQSYMC